MKQIHKWTEDDTELFLQYGKIFAPERDVWEQAFVELIPADFKETFTVVDLAAGGGWLSEAILNHYPKAHVLALDGSESMILHCKLKFKMHSLTFKRVGAFICVEKGFNPF